MDIRNALLDPTVVSIAREPRTTDGAVAILNLQTQIDAHERSAMLGRAGLVELLALRGHVLGRIDDVERADEVAEQLAHDAGADGMAFLARARMRATFHRFTEALSDLEEAERLGMRRGEVDGERAGIFQAVGRYDEAFAIRQAAVEQRRDFETLGALALLHAERGETAAAEALFDASRTRYRAVSPFPLAMLDFQRGRMWLEQEDLPRARAWFGAAWRRLPAYAPAQGHLAEVEAALGEHETALARLAPLTRSSDDPDYVGQFARILGESGRTEEARSWLALAAARYDALVLRHPAAYADHAAEFWLTTGADPDKALGLARTNLDVRRTPRARELVARAARARSARGAIAPGHDGALP